MTLLDEGSALSELFPIIFNNAFDAIIIYQVLKASDGKIIDFVFRFMNDTCFKFLKGSRTNYIGRKFRTVFPFADAEGLLADFIKVAQTGIPAEKDFYHPHSEVKRWFRNCIVSHDDVLLVYFRDITQSKIMEQSLHNSLQEKELLLKEVHHRVRNSLQLLSSIFTLQSLYFDDARISYLFTECQNRIKAISLVHEKLYEGKSFYLVDLKGYIYDLVSKIYVAMEINPKKIKVIYNIDDVKIATHSALHLGVLLNELITNSFKYAFPGNRKGEIKIDIASIDDKITICIQDNGVGLPKNIDIKQTETLGMQIVFAMTDQLNGTLTVDTHPGTKFTLILDRSFLRST